MKLPQVSSHTLIKKFKRMGYLDAPFQGKGSHVALYKDADGTKLLVIIQKRGSYSDWNPDVNYEASPDGAGGFLSFSHQLIGPLPARDDGASSLS